MTDQGRATPAATQTATPGENAAAEPTEQAVPSGWHPEAGGAGSAPIATAEPGFAVAPIAEAEPGQAEAAGPRAQAIVPAEPQHKPAAPRPLLGPREQALRILGVALILLGALVLGF